MKFILLINGIHAIKKGTSDSSFSNIIALEDDPMEKVSIASSARGSMLIQREYEEPKIEDDSKNISIEDLEDEFVSLQQQSNDHRPQESDVSSIKDDDSFGQFGFVNLRQEFKKNKAFETESKKSESTVSEHENKNNEIENDKKKFTDSEKNKEEKFANLLQGIPISVIVPEQKKIVVKEVPVSNTSPKPIAEGSKEWGEAVVLFQNVLKEVNELRKESGYEALKAGDWVLKKAWEKVENASEGYKFCARAIVDTKEEFAILDIGTTTDEENKMSPKLHSVTPPYAIMGKKTVKKLDKELGMHMHYGDDESRVEKHFPCPEGMEDSDERNEYHMGLIFLGDRGLAPAIFSSGLEQFPKEYNVRTEYPHCALPIRNQGQCGSCYAFAATAVVEERLCIERSVSLIQEEAEVALIQEEAEVEIIQEEAEVVKARQESEATKYRKMQGFDVRDKIKQFENGPNKNTDNRPSPKTAKKPNSPWRHTDKTDTRPIAGRPGAKPDTKPIPGRPGAKPDTKPIAGRPGAKPDTKPIAGRPGANADKKPIAGRPGANADKKPIAGRPGANADKKPIAGQPGGKTDKKPSTAVKGEVLSVQELVSCGSSDKQKYKPPYCTVGADGKKINEYANGCDGAAIQNVLMYIHYYGLSGDQCSKYVSGGGSYDKHFDAPAGHVPSCEDATKSKLCTNSSQNRVGPPKRCPSGDINCIKEGIHKKGSVTAGILTFESFVKLYKGMDLEERFADGVYTKLQGPDNKKGGHAISLFGWGTTKAGVPFWWGRNSWGTDWGIKGFFKIRMGTNEAGVEDDVHYPFSTTATESEISDTECIKVEKKGKHHCRIKNVCQDQVRKIQVSFLGTYENCGSQRMAPLDLEPGITIDVKKALHCRVTSDAYVKDFDPKKYVEEIYKDDECVLHHNAGRIRKVSCGDEGVELPPGKNFSVPARFCKSSGKCPEEVHEGEE